MNWFTIALFAPALWALSNFIDKYLVERFVKQEGTVVTLLLYSTLFSMVVFPLIYIVNPSVLAVEPKDMWVLIGAGVIEVVSIGFYLRALFSNDASTALPFFQTIPVFSFFLGFLFLQETLATNQLIAGAVIILGGMILALEKGEKGTRLKISLLALMLSASFFFALYDTLFKLGAIETSFWTSVFWQHVGVCLSGAVIFLARKRHRTEFISSIKENGRRIFSLNVANEVIYAVGVMIFSYALLLAPIAIVATVNVYHPIFVFVVGLFLTLFFPHIIKESLEPRQVIIKIVAIAIIFAASVYLGSTTDIYS